MLTNPNTLGLFEEDIAAIAAAVHEVGGLLYYDGANLNAILGVVRPGDMGFDIVHLNLHKTFATPHGGGGPGRRSGGRVDAARRLPARAPPGAPGGDRRRRARWPSSTAGPPRRARSAGSTAGTATPWCWPAPSPTSRSTAATGCAGWPSGRCSTPTGSASACAAPTTCPSTGPCMHEVVLAAATLRKEHGVRALDVAKRLLEEGFHSPDGLLPADRRRGADDRADRDREPPDPRGAGRRARAHRRRRRHASPTLDRGARAPPRCAGSTRPGRPAPSSRPSTAR